MLHHLLVGTKYFFLFLGKNSLLFLHVFSFLLSFFIIYTTIISHAGIANISKPLPLSRPIINPATAIVAILSLTQPILCKACSSAHHTLSKESNQMCPRRKNMKWGERLLREQIREGRQVGILKKMERKVERQKVSKGSNRGVEKGQKRRIEYFTLT